MSEREDRPVSLLQSVEKLQHTIIRDYNPVSAVDSKSIKVEQNKRKAALLAQERNVILTLGALATRSHNALSSVNLLTKKTKVSISESYHEVKASSCTHPPVQWRCELRYISLLRNVTGVGVSNSKKQAKVKAAIQLIEGIKPLLTREFE